MYINYYHSCLSSPLPDKLKKPKLDLDGSFLELRNDQDTKVLNITNHNYFSFIVF